jgi:hypothetical protein
MKRFAIMSLVFILANFAMAQNSVLFLVGAGQEATGPEPSDDVVLDLLDSFGWDVEIIYYDDPSMMTDDLGLDKDLVVISSTVNSGHIGNFYYDKAVPVLSWEMGMYGKLGIATGGGNITISDVMLFILPDGEGHAALGEYTGEVEVLLNFPMEVTLVDTNQYSEDLLPLAEMITDDGNPLCGIFAIEEGATLLDSTAAPARRMGFFFRDKTAEDATEDAINILGLCCKWTMGVEETSIEDLKQAIADYQLFNNYPNPFNPTTNIAFSLPETEDITLTVYNSLGRKVRTLLSGGVSEGKHSILWDGTDDSGDIVPSGMYFYELKSDRGVLQKKMILVK